jgi:hypothetical protein
MFLLLPISLPVWNLLPKLRFLQFPWRWLVVTEAPIGILVAAAIWPTRRWLRAVVITASTVAFLVITAVTLHLFHQHCDSEDRVSSMLAVYRSGQGFEGSDEYAPTSADNSLMAVGLPDACLTTNPAVVLASSDDGNTPQWDPANPHCDATYGWLHDTRKNPAEHLHLIANTPHAGFLILRLRNYAAWRVNVNHQTVALDAHRGLGALPRRDDGLMAVPVPQGPVQVDVDWMITGDVVMGRMVSLMSLGYLFIVFLIERKLNSAETLSRSSQPHLG